MKYRGKMVGSFTPTTSGEWIYGLLREDLPNEWSINGRQVMPYSIGRYAEINDISGEEIYVGDIVREANEDKRGVVINARADGFRVKYDSNTIVPLKGKQWEVVGNIFDNEDKRPTDFILNGTKIVSSYLTKKAGYKAEKLPYNSKLMKLYSKEGGFAWDYNFNEDVLYLGLDNRNDKVTIQYNYGGIKLDITAPLSAQDFNTIMDTIGLARYRI